MNREEEIRLSQLSPFEVKNTLMNLAETNHDYAMINAGRGNPNWIALEPREAFFQLGMFALEVSKESFNVYKGVGGIPEKKGLYFKFKAFHSENKNDGTNFLLKAIDFVNKNYEIDKDDLLNEWVNGILGDNYPVPDRMLFHTESIVKKYILQEMVSKKLACKIIDRFDLFAVEGGTAAMLYIFNTLKSNRLLKENDTIALGTPIFTPYIEIPELEDYNLNVVNIEAKEENEWQIPDEELNKLLDKKIKAFFLVNPSNPASVKLSDETLIKIKNIVENNRPDLIVLTDDVYGTFTDGFNSLFSVIPENTILVYSFSKYFGATGWRLGVIGVHENNIFDKKIKEHSQDIKELLFDRYKGISLSPNDLKFIDRLVADSRAVALNHTAGLSTPQQIQMSLLSLLSLMDIEGDYKLVAQNIVKKRYKDLMLDNRVNPVIGFNNQNGAFYYVDIDIERMTTLLYGEAFFNWLSSNYNSLDVVIRLAEEKAVVLMPGGGFDAPEWSVRVSLANLKHEKYIEIMDNLNDILDGYKEIFDKN